MNDTNDNISSLDYVILPDDEQVNSEFFANQPLSPTQMSDHMTKLDPAYILVLRITAFIWAVIIAIPIFILDIALASKDNIEPFIIAAPLSLIFIMMAFLLPRRRYRRWGYDMGDKQIQIVRGYLFYKDTIVPFSRVQHIDVAQGPIERLFGLSSLVLHTAGTHNSTVVLPGLRRDTAEHMRDIIRIFIKSDMV